MVLGVWHTSESQFQLLMSWQTNNSVDGKSAFEDLNKRVEYLFRETLLTTEYPLGSLRDF